MKSLARMAVVAAFFVGAAGCALVAGIEDFNVVASDAGDDVVVTSDDGASGGDGNGGVDVDGAADVSSTEAAVAQDGSVESSAADVAPSDAPVVGDTGGCTPACSSGQSCENNECWPQTIATGRSTPTSIIVVNGSVVWVETQGLSNTVVACPVTGCTTTPTVVRTNLTSAVLRRASPTSNTLVEIDQGASDARTVTSALSTATVTQEDHVWGAAIALNVVLYGTRDKVKFCSPPCVGAQQISYGKTPPTGPAMAVEAGRAYWTPPNGGVQSCDLPSCSTPLSFGDGTTVLDFQVGPSGVAALTTSMLGFYDMTGTATDLVPLSGGTALVAVSSTFYVAAASGIAAVDGSSHNVTTRWPASSPRGLATDGTFLYWTEGSSVLRAPK